MTPGEVSNERPTPAFRAQRCVVTGASSFVGAHLAAKLARDGHSVLATTRRPRNRYDGIRASRLAFAAANGARSAALDLLDLAAVEAFIRRHRPTVWFHHAGWVQGYASHDYDLEAAWRTNVRPLATVFRVLRDIGARGIVATGSSAEYSVRERPNFEDEVCYPSLPYGMSKLEQTVRIAQLATRFGVKARVARVFIPFGPLDDPGKVVPQIVDALTRREPIRLSPGTQKRDFLYIDDLVDGFLRLHESLDRPETFGLYNLCSGRPLTLKDLATKICGTAGADESLLRFGARPMRDGEAMYSCGSADKARRDLGFAPRSVDRAVAAYVADMARR